MRVAVAEARDLRPDEVRARVKELLARGPETAFLRHATAEQFAAARDVAPEASRNERSGLVVLTRPRPRCPLPVAVVSAGTSDLPVAEEALTAAEALGLSPTLTADIGVAGLHRLLGVRAELSRARVLIVAAGMDGALPSAVARLVARPVLAVPTGVGYGTAAGGLAALAAMLASGAPGLAVTGIDDGLGAAITARRMLT
ncbi:nickel pincer cofactor biosynthesis protein LarB [Actinomadura geliboluensis]